MNQQTATTPLEFEYLYSNGERIFKKTFTIDEILAGEPVKIILMSDLLKGFTIIGERQFTGKTLNSGQKVFDKDILKLICPSDDGQVKEYITAVEFVPEASAFLISTEKKNDCFLGIISDSPLATERSYMEIIGNTIEHPELIIECNPDLPVCQE